MQAAPARAFLSVEEYIAGEQRSDVRHEYIGGEVYAMAGGSVVHNTLCLNLAAALRSHLRGGPCQVFMADVKLRHEIARDDVFYYPDVMVACDARDTDPFFKRFPQVLIEVLSETTERVDRREKFLTYTRIETLEEYVLVAQDRREVTLFRRATGWQPELFKLPEQSLRLPSLDFALALTAAYEGVKI